MNKPNVLFILSDQLRAMSLPIYGETNITTPNIDKLASEGVVLDNCISTCPVCTPYRAMLLTGRHPQTTGHIINSTRTRHDEISIADAFAHQGYKTGWVGKWHLHTGVWPAQNVPDWVPEGRDRLGFQYWRAYNMHMVYNNGYVNKGDWNYETWKGYETEALASYAVEFMDQVGEDERFCLFLSPHQPHFTPFDFAPQRYYDKLPDELVLPGNVPDNMVDKAKEMYRHYLAMILALDDMVGELVNYLNRAGKSDNTIIVFTSDHGTQAGGQGIHPWSKKEPYEESIHVPCIIKYKGVLEGGVRMDTLTAPVDFFPSLCSLAGVPIPKTVEGVDLSEEWNGKFGHSSQDEVLLMNFSSKYDWFSDGKEWRGVRTRSHSYAKWLNQKEVLYDIVNDPLQINNLAEQSEHVELLEQMRERLRHLQQKRGDELVACTEWKNWLDHQRRVVRNAFGPLRHPEHVPDWSLL
jgi:arylsulfatase A-like enzyme